MAVPVPGPLRPPRLRTLAEVAARLEISQDHVMQLVDEGALAAVDLSSRSSARSSRRLLRFEDGDVEQLIERRKTRKTHSG